MSVEMICQRGSGSFLVKKEDKYYFVNMASGKYNVSDDPGVFLKLGYFEDPEGVDDALLKSIDEVISSEENCAAGI